VDPSQTDCWVQHISFEAIFSSASLCGNLFLMYGLLLAGTARAGMLFIPAKYTPMARGITCLNT